MITTVCMNPTFDKTATVSKLSVGEVNRLTGVRVDVGGKGVNVATVLKRLGVEVGCVGCLGSSNASTFLQMIQTENVAFDYISVPGEVRTNLKLLDDENKTITEFNEPGITLTEAQLQSFIALLTEKSASSDYVVLSGKMPMGCMEETYERCMRAIEHPKCVLDVAGEALLHGIKAKPYLIKPNLPELESIMKKELRTIRAIRDAAHLLLSYGAQNAIVSMGKYGALFTNGTETLFAPSLQIQASSTVGAGDAMVGGVLHGLDRGESFKEALRYGVAAGAASVMTDGTQLMRKEDFDELLPKVTVQVV